MVTQPPQQPDPANPRGWHPDPAGVPGRYRFWDGQQWREDVTFDENAPFPDEDTTQRPGMSRGARIGLVAGGAVVVVGLVLVLALVVVPALRAPEPETSTEPPIAPPSGGQGTPGTGTGELNCAGGNQVSIDDQATSYSSTGATVTMPADWGFRLQKDQWTWLDDQAAWGTMIKEGEDSFVTAAVFGGLAERNGFTEPEKATADVITCLNRYGVYNDKDYPQQELASEEVTINEMAGWKRVQEFTESEEGNYPKSVVTVYVLDSGQPAKLVSLVTVAPVGHTQSEEAVEKIAQSLTKE